MEVTMEVTTEATLQKKKCLQSLHAANALRVKIKIIQHSNNYYKSLFPPKITQSCLYVYH